MSVPCAYNIYEHHPTLFTCTVPSQSCFLLVHIYFCIPSVNAYSIFLLHHLLFHLKTFIYSYYSISYNHFTYTLRDLIALFRDAIKKGAVSLVNFCLLKHIEDIVHEPKISSIHSFKKAQILHTKVSTRKNL